MRRVSILGQLFSRRLIVAMATVLGSSLRFMPTAGALSRMGVMRTAAQSKVQQERCGGDEGDDGSHRQADEGMCAILPFVWHSVNIDAIRCPA